jgi:hypothetical protein
MRLIDASTGQMECRVCGSQHFANIRPASGGNYYRGSWRCLNGCRLPERSSNENAGAPSDESAPSKNLGGLGNGVRRFNGQAADAAPGGC